MFLNSHSYHFLNLKSYQSSDLFFFTEINVDYSSNSSSESVDKSSTLSENSVGGSKYSVGESLVGLDGRVELTGDYLLSVDLDDITRQSLLQQGK